MVVQIKLRVARYFFVDKHEANASKAEDQHGPGGGLGDGRCYTKDLKRRRPIGSATLRTRRIVGKVST